MAAAGFSSLCLGSEGVFEAATHLGRTVLYSSQDQLHKLTRATSVLTTTLEIYERLVAGERISVRLPSKQRYEVLRTELCRHHRITRDLLGQSFDAICSHYSDSVGVFHIGLPAGKTPVTFTAEVINA